MACSAAKKASWYMQNGTNLRELQQPVEFVTKPGHKRKIEKVMKRRKT